MLPPLEQQRVADELEPWGKLQSWVVEHGLQSIGGNIFRISDFVKVRLDIDICLDEQDVVN